MEAQLDRVILLNVIPGRALASEPKIQGFRVRRSRAVPE